MKVRIVVGNPSIERFGWSAVKGLFVLLILSLIVNPISKGRSDRQAGRSETVLPAEIRAGDLFPVAAETGGRVAEVLVQAGQKVAAGELLATIQSEELDRQIERARARLEINERRLRESGSTQSNSARTRWLDEQYRAARRQVEVARQRLESFSDAEAQQAVQEARRKTGQIAALVAQKLATAQELEDARRSEQNEIRALAARGEQAGRLRQELEAAESHARLAKLQTESAGGVDSEAIQFDHDDAAGALEALEARRKTLRLVARGQGTVTRVEAAPGVTVGAGAVLFQIADTSRLHFDTLVPASVARQIRPGQTVNVRLPLDPPQEMSAPVAKVLLQPEQQSYVIRVTIPNPAPHQILVGLQGAIGLPH